MEVQPTKWEVQPLFYKPNNMWSSLISWNGIKYYNFKIESIEPSYWIAKFNYLIYHTECEVIKCDGYFDRDNKIIYFFYNRKINKQYKTLVKTQKLERQGQTFLISDTRGKEQNMSLKELGEIKSNRVDAKDIPPTIVPTKIVYEKRADPKDKVTCAYLDFYWMQGKDEVVTTTKYRPFHVKELLARLKELKSNGVEGWVGKTWRLEKEPFGTLGFPKLLPVTDEMLE